MLVVLCLFVTGCICIFYMLCYMFSPFHTLTTPTVQDGSPIISFRWLTSADGKNVFNFRIKGPLECAQQCHLQTRQDAVIQSKLSTAACTMLHRYTLKNQQ